MNEINEGFADAESELDDAKKKIEDGEKALEDGQKQMMEQIADGSNQIVNGKIEIICLFKDIGSFTESFCNDCVQSNVCGSNGIGGTNHTELELVAGEGERRGSVTVGSVTVNGRQESGTGV